MLEQLSSEGPLQSSQGDLRHLFLATITGSGQLLLFVRITKGFLMLLNSGLLTFSPQLIFFLNLFLQLLTIMLNVSLLPVDPGPPGLVVFSQSRLQLVSLSHLLFRSLFLQSFPFSFPLPCLFQEHNFPLFFELVNDLLSLFRTVQKGNGFDCYFLLSLFLQGSFSVGFFLDLFCEFSPILMIELFSEVGDAFLEYTFFWRVVNLFNFLFDFLFLMMGDLQFKIIDAFLPQQPLSPPGFLRLLLLSQTHLFYEFPFLLLGFLQLLFFRRSLPHYLHVVFNHGLGLLLYFLRLLY